MLFWAIRWMAACGFREMGSETYRLTRKRRKFRIGCGREAPETWSQAGSGAIQTECCGPSDRVPVCSEFGSPSSGAHRANAAPIGSGLSRIRQRSGRRFSHAATGRASNLPPSLQEQRLGPGLTELLTLCRVRTVIRPVPDSGIKVRVWIPETGWNGKFVGVGNGGWAGRIANNQQMF